MTVRSVLTLFASICFVSTNCLAKCADFDSNVHIQAEVQVWHCVAATFGAVDARFYDFGPLYTPGASFSGTVLNVRIQQSHIVRDDPKNHATSPKPWKPGEMLTVFVADSSTQVCPASIPSNLTITTREICCDTLPKKDVCLVPLQVVVIAPQR